MRIRWTLLLPATQFIVSCVLLFLGSRELATGLQDSAPSVSLEIKICEALNAPAAVLATGLLYLIRWAHIDLGTSQVIIGESLFIVGTLLIWFLIGLEIQVQLVKRASTLRRLFVWCVLALFVAVMIFFGIVEWREGEILISIGALTWSVLLTAFFGRRLIASSLAHRTEGS